MYLLTLILIAGSLQAGLPPTPTNLSGGVEGERVGVPMIYRTVAGVTNTVPVKSRSAVDFPVPDEPEITGLSGGFRKHVGETQPHYRMKVWSDLTQDYIEFRAYVPGNSAFFHGELVLP